MRLVLTRHGQTHDNVLDLSSGQNDACLTESGKRQAIALGQRLANLRVQRIFASDLPRVRETVLGIETVFSVPIEFRADLRERHFGSLDRKTLGEYMTALQASGSSWDNFRPDAGESFVDITKRACAVLEDILATSDECVAVIAHGNLNKAVLAHLLGGHPWNYEQATGCINLLRIDRPSMVTVEALNDVSHLPSLPEVEQSKAPGFLAMLEAGS